MSSSPPLNFAGFPKNLGFETQPGDLIIADPIYSFKRRSILMLTTKTLGKLHLPSFVGKLHWEIQLEKTIPIFVFDRGTVSKARQSKFLLDSFDVIVRDGKVIWSMYKLKNCLVSTTRDEVFSTLVKI